MIFTQLTSIPIVDSHVHVFPGPVAEAVRRWFATHAWQFRYEGGMDELLSMLFGEGLAGAVLLSYAHRPGMAELLNEFTASLVRRFPGTAGLAAVHPHDPHPRAIVRRALRDLGLSGVKLHCHVLKMAPDDAALFPIYEAVLEHDGVLTIHGGKEPSIAAYGMDVRAISGAEEMGRVLRRYPRLKVIVPHLGIDETERFYSFLERYENLYLDTTMILSEYFHAGPDREGLIRHSERILYGSDFPHIPYEMEKEVKALLDMDLGEGPTRRILLENAARLFPSCRLPGV
jgi:predicted TIM-barrel fold metal-dependent hydrolase